MPGKTIASINVRIGAVITGLEKGLADAERSLGRSGRKLSRLGDSLTKSVSVPLAAIGGIGLKMANDLGTSFGKIEDLVGITGGTLQSFKKGVADISNTIKKPQKELADALFVVTSAGERGANALTILQQAAKASKIGLGDTTEIARATTAVIQAYGKENINASKAIDILTATIREGNLEAEALAPVLGNVVGLAAKMGVSFEEVGASVATFTRLGISAENAVTGLSGLLSGLLKPTKDGAKALAAVGMSFDSVRKAIKDKGLAATLIDLMKAFEGNEEALSAVIPNVRALRTVLGTAGAQGEEYIKIAENISRSTGLVDAAFENASQRSAAKFKAALVALQNVGLELGQKLLPLATRVAEVFTIVIDVVGNLPTPVKNVTLSVLKFVAVIGPTLKVLGLFKTNLANLAGTAKVLVSVLKKASIAFIGLGQVAKIGVFGALTLAVSGVIAVFDLFTSSLSANEEATKRLQAAQKSIAKETAMERSQLEKLIQPLKEANLSTDDRKAALDKLQRTYPGYFNNIKAEKVDLQELDRIQKRLNVSILEGVAARKKNEALNDIYAEIVEKELRIQEIQEKGFESLSFYQRQTRNAIADITNLWTDAGREFAVNDAIEKLEADIKILRTEADATGKSFDKIFNLGKTRRSGRGSAPSLAKSEIDKPDTPIVSGADLIPDIEPTADKINNRLRPAIEGLIPLTNTLKGLEILPGVDVIERKRNLLVEIGQINPIQQMLESGAMEAATEKFAALSEKIANTKLVMSGLTEPLQAIGAELVNTAVQGAASFKELARAALGAAAKVIRAKIAEGVAALVAKTLGTGPLGLIAAPLAAAGATALFNKILGKFNIPALAQGGLAFGEQLAIVGDNPNARRDPEVIAPLSKLKNMMGDTAGGIGRLEGEFRISGRDLVLLLEDAKQTLSRQRGF